MAYLAARGRLYAKPETERRVIEAYHRAFPNKVLMARYAGGHAGSQPWLGFHDDLFPQDTDNGEHWSFLAAIRRSGRTANWEKAAIGGEMVPHRAKQWLGEGRADERHGRARPFYMGRALLSGASLPRTRQSSGSKASRWSGDMGYQFRLTEVRHAGEVANGGTLAAAIRALMRESPRFIIPGPSSWRSLTTQAAWSAAAHRLATYESGFPGVSNSKAGWKRDLPRADTSSLSALSTRGPVGRRSALPTS